MDLLYLLGPRMPVTWLLLIADYDIIIPTPLFFITLVG